jgi:uncharacterized membrane protein YedE/YeeE
MKLTRIQLHLRYAALGLLFGFALSRIGFSDYGEVHKMFTFTEFRLLLTFAGGVALAMIGFAVLAHHRDLQKKTLHKGTIPGSILFGIGWALTGSCPSIALVQLGEGYLPAVFTVMGIILGAWGYKHAHRQLFRWDTGSCE